MYSTPRKRPATLFVPMGLLIFLGGGGLIGGAAMLLDPKGHPMGLSVALLDPVPIDSFLLPGLFVLTVFGAAPLVAAFGMWALPEWRWLQQLTLWPEFHWSWTWARVEGVVLILWIALEFLLWGNASPLQPVLLGVGLALLIMCGYPSVRRYMHMAGTPAIVPEHRSAEEDRDNTDNSGQAKG